MNNLKKLFIITPVILVFIFVVYILICRNIYKKLEYQYTQQFNDYSVLPNNQRVAKKVELGKSNKKLFWGLDYEIKNGALEIVCTDRGNVLLVLKSDLNENFNYMTANKSASFYASFRMENMIPKGEAKIREMNFIDDGTYLNTMASSSLSKQEADSIIKALEERNLDRDIGLGFSETGFGFKGNAKTSDVKRLVSECKNNNN